MATLQALRKEAKGLGISASEIRSASSAADLKALIVEYNGKPKKSVAKKAVSKAVKKEKTAKVSAKKSPAAKSTKGKAKRASSTPTSKYVPKGGRNIIRDVDFSKTKGWNPRKGSAPDRIVKAVAKAKGNRERAFQALVGDVWDFVGKTKRNGQRRTKAESHAMLKYRIARTLFDFVRQTKQHKVATNRIEYGSGPHAKATKAASRKTAKAAKPKAAAK